MIRYLLFLFLLPALNLYAQDPFHIIYGIDDGLPSEEVYDVHVDSDDIVWVTTDRGVSRYNGYEFENFNTSDGLAYNTNFKIFPDHLDRLWFLGFDGSISIYEGCKFRMSEYSKAIQNKGYNKLFLYGLGYDSVGTVYTHHANPNILSNIDSYFKLVENNQVEELNFGDTCTAQSIEMDLCIKSIEFENTSFIYIPKVSSISLSHVNIGKNAGLFLYPLTAKEWISLKNKKLPQLYKYKNGLITEVLASKAVLNSITKDNFGNILVCSTAGVYIYKNGDLSIPPERYFVGKQFSDVYQDKNNNYWFSSEKDGLYFVPTFDSKVIDQQGLIKDSKKMVSHGDYLFYYYGSNKVDYIDKNFNISSCEYLENLPQSEYSQVGLSKLFITNHKGKFYRKSSKSPRGLLNLLLRLDNGDQLGTGSDLVIKRDGSIFFNSNNVEENILTNSVLRKVLVHDEDIWFSTLRFLYKISDYEYDNLQKIMDKGSLLNVRLNDFEFDSQGTMWLASIGNGLLQKKDDKITQIDVSDGLSSNQINTIHLENDTSIWLGSNNGLDWVRLTQNGDTHKIKSIHNFNTKDGLLSNYINDITFWNDKLWIASKNGLQHINLKNAIQEVLPKIAIKGIKVNDSDLDIRNNLDLKYNENNITFFYEGVSYNKPKGDFYKYKIEKKNESANWNLTNNRSVIFQNLSAGDYTFSVNARNKNNEWGEVEKYSFSIAPHFASTWWFWLLCALLLAGITFYIYNKRLQYLINKNKQDRVLQDAILRTKIAELSTFRNQFNPHFIFNSLNSIQNYIFDKDVRQANSFLSKFSKLIRESLNLSDKKLVSIEKEFAFMKSYLELEFLRFPDKFAFEFHNVDDIPIDLYQMPPLLIQPVIENVVKHAFKGTVLGKLNISVKQHESESGMIMIIIEDNGTGIKLAEENIQNDKHKSFGIKIVHDRIKLLNNDYPYLNSSFTITNKASSSGTIAKFVIPKITIDQA